MIRAILFILIVHPILAFSQDKTKLMKLKELDFTSFPTQFATAQKVFEHYYKIGIADKKLDSLNEAQKTLCFHFICDGLIDNLGFYSILLETNGEFNLEYLKALDRIGDTTDRIIFDEIVSIYNKYEKWFSKQTNPPALNENSMEFDGKLFNRIEELEKKWYENGKIREDLFKDYFETHKLELVNRE